MWTPRISFVFASLVIIALAACSGGGGTSGGGGGGGITPPTPTPIPTQSTTTASGSVVDDTNGNPLGGVKVALRPWIACTSSSPSTISCPTALPAPQATTASDGTFTLANAPNGHYFLVIGDDTPGSNVTTVHSNVTLIGGTVALAAPNMPPVPTVTPPAWETSGKYRIETLDAANEAPCFTEFNIQRAVHSLPAVVADQWLLESSRAFMRNSTSSSPSSPPWPGNSNGILADTYDYQSGGSSCVAMVDGAFGNPLNPGRNVLTTWYGGYYVPIDYGIEQELSDPATQASTKGVVWP